MVAGEPYRGEDIHRSICALAPESFRPRARRGFIEAGTVYCRQTRRERRAVR